MDADCASKLACFNGECKNPCIETKPCGTNAECRVVDTLPLRTMSCHCLPGYIGDADVQCTSGRIISTLISISKSYNIFCDETMLCVFSLIASMIAGLKQQQCHITIY